MMRTMTPMMTQSEAPACPPAPPSLPMTAAEALAAVVVVLLNGGLPVVMVVDVWDSSIGGFMGGFLVVGFGSDFGLRAISSLALFCVAASAGPTYTTSSWSASASQSSNLSIFRPILYLFSPMFLIFEAENLP